MQSIIDWLNGIVTPKSKTGRANQIFEQENSGNVSKE